MTSLFARGLGGAFLALAATGVLAQESTNQVAAKTDWSVFQEPLQNPKECWSVSSPKESTNTKDGRLVAVNRGTTLMFVSYMPDQGVKGQVSFTGGYAFKTGSTVNLDIGGTSFEMFTDGEMAWAATNADDAKIVTAMKRGSSAVLTGVSERSGTQTKDTFSLLGFTAALEEAEKRCGG